jgi:hypothetical protein
VTAKRRIDVTAVLSGSAIEAQGQLCMGACRADCSFRGMDKVPGSIGGRYLPAIDS